ncbi:MAG: amidase family protein, partial [Smithellaceae bacterium]
MELNQLTIHELQEKIKNGETSATQITESVFDRINAVEERVHSYIRLMRDEALAAAKKADEEIKKGEINTLTGIPIALKDIVCTKGINTTCGSRILHNFVPPYDATVVEKL